MHGKGLKFGLWYGHAMCQSTNDTAQQPSTEHGGVRSTAGPSWEAVDFAKLDAEFFRYESGARVQC